MNDKQSVFLVHLFHERPDLLAGLLPKVQEDFMAWLPANTHVVSAFLRYARELKRTGKRDYYSAYAIRERLRWDSMVSEVGTEFKISNNMTPALARLVMAIDPSLDGMFKLKGEKNESR